MSERQQPSVEFAKRLAALQGKDDRSRLAVLRRGLDRRLGEDGQATTAFYDLLPPAVQWNEETYYLVATLFARMPGGRQAGAVTDDETASPAAPRRDRSLAHAMARLAGRPGVNREGVERRFAALLDADGEAVAFRLRQAIGLFRGQPDLTWDWAQLIDDLCAWSHPDRYVQRRWARAFYSNVDRLAADPTTKKGE